MGSKNFAELFRKFSQAFPTGLRFESSRAFVDHNTPPPPEMLEIPIMVILYGLVDMKNSPI